MDEVKVDHTTPVEETVVEINQELIPIAEDWSWVHRKYPRRVRVLLEFEQDTDWCEINKPSFLGEALLNIVGENFSLSDSFTLKTDRGSSVRITRVSKRRGCGG